jgi:alcohol dehydrogenase, propanol-preferring
VLIKVMANGICHTDLHTVNGDWGSIKPTLQRTPGHEGAGVVAAVGPVVKQFKEVDRAGVAWLHDACGWCEYCRTGWDALCRSQRNTGFSVNGSFAEYVIGSAPYVGRLPDNVDFAAVAPVLCAGVTTYQAIKETEAKPGEWLVISGVGGLGQLGIEYAKAMGLCVVAVDVTEEKLALARASGADVAVNAKAPNAVTQVVEHTDGGGHGVLVTAVVPSAFRQAIDMVRRRGTLTLVGLPPGDFPIPIVDVVLNRITLRGSIVGGRQDLAEAIEFAGRGKVHSHYHEVKLGDVNQVFSDMKAGKLDGRMVITSF